MKINISMISSNLKLLNRFVINFLLCQFIIAGFITIKNSQAVEADAKKLQENQKAETAKLLISDICSKIATINSNANLLQDKKLQEITNVIDANTDAEWIAKFILGKNYRIMTEEQRKKFITSYHDFLLQTYAPKMQKFSGNNFKILQVSENKQFLVVKTEFTLKDGKKPVVEFKIKQQPSGKMTIIDFIAEGVSFIETQRAEFGSAIATDGVEKFLQILSQRVANQKNQVKKSN